MIAELKNTLRDLLVYVVLCAGTFLMLRIIAPHFTLQPNVGFLQVKQAQIDNNVWRWAFYLHVFTAILSLLAGFTQFSSYILKEHKVLHRVMGRVYVFSILVINFPSGMIMAIYANGFWPTQMAFIILDSLWFWFTLKAFLEIKKGKIISHKEYMMRSYALTFSAITLRTWKLVLSSLFVLSPLALYQIEAWMGFVPNLLLIEWWIRKGKKKRLATKTDRTI